MIWSKKENPVFKEEFSCDYSIDAKTCFDTITAHIIATKASYRGLAYSGEAAWLYPTCTTSHFVRNKRDYGSQRGLERAFVSLDGYYP